MLRWQLWRLARLLAGCGGIGCLWAQRRLAEAWRNRRRLEGFARLAWLVRTLHAR
jgi:hypothetical protein